MIYRYPDNYNVEVKRINFEEDMYRSDYFTDNIIEKEIDEEYINVSVNNF